MTTSDSEPNEVETIKAQLNHSRFVNACTLEPVEVMGDLNNRSRRNSFIIKGFSKVEEESQSRPESRVKSFYLDVLGDEVGIFERIHRLRYKNHRDYTRPVKIKLLD